MGECLTEHVRDLYATAPDQFVAERNALEKTLKGDDRRDDAAAIARLRRPSWIDGALNRVTRVEHDVVVEFAEAARAARRIQHADAEGRRTESLPQALRVVRAAQNRLASAADDTLVALGRKADLAGVMARIGQVGAEPSELDLLVNGVLGLEGADVIASFLTDHDETNAAATAATTERDPGQDGDDVAPDGAEHQAQIDAASKAARTAEKEAKVAATAARRATERRDRAVAAVEAAEAAVRDAESALERSRSELAEHDSRAANAQRAADEAARAGADAAAHLDELLS